MSDGAYWAIRRSNGSWVGELCGSKACRKRFLSKQQASRWTCTGDVIVRVTVRPKEKPAQLTAMVREFMAMVKQEMPGSPVLPHHGICNLRMGLIAEELDEFLLAINAGNVAGAVDALADLAYVVEGGFLAFGVNSAPILAEVHRSNMSKIGGGLDAYGKATKGPNYSPPDIAGELRKQGWCDNGH